MLDNNGSSNNSNNSSSYDSSYSSSSSSNSSSSGSEVCDDDPSMSEGASGFERIEEATIDDDVANGKFQIAGHETMVFHDSENNIDCPSTGKYSSSEASSQAGEDKPKAKRRESIGHEYTSTLRKLRVLLWLVLGGIMATATAGIYVFSVIKESSVFQTEFLGHASKVIDSFQTDAHRKLEALDSLSALLTIFAIDHEQQWPNVTMPHSAPIFERYLNVIGASALHVLPIVPKDMRKQWEVYASRESGWIDEAIQETLYQSVAKPTVASEHTAHEGDDHRQLQKRIVPFIQDDSGMDETEGPWAVTWQYAPISPDPSIINYNQFSSPDFVDETVSVLEQQFASMSKIHTFSHGWEDQTRLEKFMGDHFHENLGFDENAHEPFVYIHYPVFETVKHNSSTVAIVTATLYWKNYFENVLPEGIEGMICVVENSKGQAFSYRMDGPVATLLGLKDMHDPSYDYIAQVGTYVSNRVAVAGDNSDIETIVHLDEDFMSYTLRVYPSATFEANYKTSTPVIVSVSMLMLFIITAVVFKLYDCLIGRRQDVIMAKAAKTDDIVASLFPETVRARILGENDRASDHFAPAKKRKSTSGQSVASARSVGTKSAYDTGGVIADFYPEATVLFTDIKGFTAWCSEREPSQVFILLETLYNTYDLIAKKRGVFKVETIGDCYMAVTGLPEPRADHAVVMCKFAHECLSKMNGLLSGLEVTLGPGTADLSMRFGIHSGPVTAGVIRSQNARFQLFGDTVNTASRMESTGEAGMIHLSQETADQLINFGKKHWFTARKDKIVAKGKGELQTYWLTRLVSDEDNRSTSTPSVQSAPTEALDMSPTIAAVEAAVKAVEAEEQVVKEKAIVDAKLARLVDWNVDVLNRLLGLVVARRSKRGKASPPTDLVLHSYGPMVIDQMQEAQLPMFDPAEAAPVDAAELDSFVVDQLYDYVHSITKLYENHPFHCYEHASHVAMSVLKLLGRIILPSDIAEDDARNAFSDPLTQFTCVLSALVHDVGHLGVPNNQLAKEKSQLAMYYNGQSIAEQNSIDVAWALLMKPEYANLRGAIYCDQEEMERFRYLLVTGIMATDIADDKLKAIRNMRWQRAFARTAALHDPPPVISSRKAIIVIEHLMQASDLAHTMQHWHVYRKWNERYFQECVVAYQAGRSTIDPTQGWYQGELSFFNNCIIPLAKKLKECSVFGVSSEEYLNYAIKNRDQWESQGKEILGEMIAKLQ